MKSTVVCSPGGASSNFLAHLVAKHKGWGMEYTSALPNNEYLIGLTPHGNNAHTFRANGYDEFYYYRNTEHKWKKVINASAEFDVIPAHPGNVFSTIDQLNDYEVINIVTDERVFDFTAACAIIKNIVDRYTIEPNPYLHKEMDLNKFIKFTKELKEVSDVSNSTSPVSLIYFYTRYNNHLDLDDYITFTQKSILDRIHECRTTHPFYKRNFVIPQATNINHYDLFFDHKPTDTLFDDYSTEIKDYHKRNIELVKKVYSYFEIPLDFYPFVDYNT